MGKMSKFSSNLLVGLAAFALFAGTADAEQKVYKKRLGFFESLFGGTQTRTPSRPLFGSTDGAKLTWWEQNQIDKQNQKLEDLNLALEQQDLNNKVVLLVDDVLNTGKTMIYALHPFLNYAVKKIATIVLVDRNHNLFPVRADYVGLSMATTLQEHISVEFSEGNDAAYLCWFNRVIDKLC